MAPLLALALALIPLAIAPGTFFYFDVTPKVLALTTAAAVVLAFMALKRTPARVNRGLAWILAAQWISLAVSTALAGEWALGLGGSNWRRLGLVTWSAILVIAWAVAKHNARQNLVLLRATACAALGVSAYASLQYFGIDPWLPGAAYHVGEGAWTIVRPPGTLGYVTYLANWLLFGVFAGAALLGAERSRFWRWTGAAAIVLPATAIVLSGTRGAMLAMLIGAMVSIRRFSWKTILAGCAAAALLVALYLSPAGLKLRARTRWYMEDPAGGARLLLWRDSLRMSADRLVLGFGPEAFPVEFPRFESLELARRYPDFYHESPHNMFLDSFAGQGLPGLGIVLAAVIGGFRFSRNARQRALTGMFAAAVVAHQFACFTVPTALFFFVSLALLAAESRRNESGEEQVHCQSTARRLAVAIPASALLLVFSVCLAVADRSLWLASKQIKAGAFQQATLSFGSTRAWAPPGFSADLWYSRAMASISKHEALEAALRATRYAEDRHNAWFSLAMLRAADNDVTGAEHALRCATAAAPNWYRPYRALAILHRYVGRFTEAAAETEMADTRFAGNGAKSR
jgi:putative inorganic carbon (hco3(-)) transporter